MGGHRFACQNQFTFLLRFRARSCQLCEAVWCNVHTPQTWLNEGGKWVKEKNSIQIFVASISILVSHGKTVSIALTDQMKNGGSTNICARCHHPSRLCTCLLKLKWPRFVGKVKKQSLLFKLKGIYFTKNALRGQLNINAYEDRFGRKAVCVGTVVDGLRWFLLIWPTIQYEPWSTKTAPSCSSASRIRRV